MKLIARLLTCPLLAAGLLSSAAHATPTPTPTPTAARSATPQLTYDLAIIRHSSPAGLTENERSEVRTAVADFLQRQSHPMSREYVVRVQFAAVAPAQPAGWVDVKLTFKAAKNYELMAYNTLFGYDAGGYPRFDNAREYSPHP